MALAHIICRSLAKFVFTRLTQRHDDGLQVPTIIQCLHRGQSGIRRLIFTILKWRIDQMYFGDFADGYSDLPYILVQESYKILEACWQYANLVLKFRRLGFRGISLHLASNCQNDCCPKITKVDRSKKTTQNCCRTLTRWLGLFAGFVKPLLSGLKHASQNNDPFLLNSLENLLNIWRRLPRWAKLRAP